jgi:voltage-gated potassium channel
MRSLGNPAEHAALGLGGPLAALALTLVLGTLGYMLIEGWAWDDALYMVVTTVTTVGFGELHPLSRLGRWFTIGLIVVGVGSLLYAFSILAGYVFEGHLTQRWQRRRMDSQIAQLDNHFILCGYGRVGRQVAADLKRERAPFVIIDVNPVSLQEAADEGLLVVFGNATDDQVLRNAGILRARALIAAVADDANNIFVTLSARSLNAKLPIVARANFQDAVHKLRLAGATRVVSPYVMAGQQMAMLAIRPSAVDFVETLLRGTRGGDLLLEDVQLSSGAALVGVAMPDLRHQFASQATVLAVRRDGRLLAPPPEDLRLQAGDVIVVAGTDGQLRQFEQACSGRPAPAPTASD